MVKKRVNQCDVRWRKVLADGPLRWKGSIDVKPHPFDEEHFETDQDSIVFSPSFRRLKDKTQVYPIAENDHVRTRMTHSIEASVIGQSVARRIGREDGLNELEALRLGAIVKAACLVHDIGHPPLGHMGETTIGEWFRTKGPQYLNSSDGDEACVLDDLAKFEGNAHGFRIVNHLENRRAAGGGLRLTCATLAASMKYPWCSGHENARPKGKFGYFATEQCYAEAVAKQMGMKQDGDGWHRHPLAYLVEAADDICYRLADAEDGIEVGDYSFAEYERLLLAFLAQTQQQHSQKVDPSVYNMRSLPHKILNLRSRAMVVLGEHACAVFHRHQETLWDATFRTGGAAYGEILRASAGNDDARAGYVHEFLDALKRVAVERLYNGARKLHIETAYHKVIHTLLTTLVEARLKPHASARHSHLLHIAGLRGVETEPARGRERAEAVRDVVDIVAGMTDHYALQLFRQIEGISHSTTSPMPLC